MPKKYGRRVNIVVTDPTTHPGHNDLHEFFVCISYCTVNVLGNTTGKSKISIKDILHIPPGHVFFHSHKIYNSFPLYLFLFNLFVIFSLPSITFRILPFRFPPNIENPACLG